VIQKTAATTSCSGFFNWLQSLSTSQRGKKCLTTTEWLVIHRAPTASRIKILISSHAHDVKPYFTKCPGTSMMCVPHEVSTVCVGGYRHALSHVPCQSHGLSFAPLKIICRHDRPVRPGWRARIHHIRLFVHMMFLSGVEMIFVKSAGICCLYYESERTHEN
jgi:hypothetical protein